MKFQDELESGQRSKSHQPDVQEEVERYRQKLLRKVRTEIFGETLLISQFLDR